MSDARTALLSMPPAPGAAIGVRSTVRLERADLPSRLKKEGALLAILMIVAALSVAIPWLKSHHLFFAPPCIFHSVTHVPCFLCGMTRSFVFTVRGDFSHAFEMHLLGPILFFMMAAVGVYLAVSLVSGYRLQVSLTTRSRRVIYWSALGVLMAAWIIKLAFMRGSW